jgi:spermidine synthase
MQLLAIFFLSGAAALIFETIWFSLAGLALGNAVWSSTIVLGAFMGGIAAGNHVAARHGHRLRRPLRFYGLLELSVGILGLGLVLLYPLLNSLLVPLFQPVLDRPLALNALRLGISFALLLVPAVAMGATLPVMIRCLGSRPETFGQSLGLLYGCNTLGALGGVAAAEAFLIETLGLRGTALAAAGMNVAACLAALALSTRLERRPAAHGDLADGSAPTARLETRAARILLAAFISGGLLLALEVVWFRFMLLFVFGSTMNFAIMLGVVLAGIGLGGLAGSWVLRARGGDLAVPLAASLAGALVIGCYAVFTSPAFGFAPGYGGGPLVSLWRGVRLMLPVSLLSGVLFTLLGHRLRLLVAPDSRAAGMLTLANTTGAMLGALLGGLALLPTLGMERSFLALGAGYGLVGLLALDGGLKGRRLLLGFSGAGALLLLASLVLFPRGQMERRVLPAVIREHPPYKLLAAREGLTETVLYTVAEQWGEPLSYRLVTNGNAMSGTNWWSKRYMKLFVYLPVALHPDPRKALLVSYGVGSTAKALTDTAALERIDVVDISRDILEMNSIVFPDPLQFPLKDPRVRVHVEDGRFFLQTTPEKFDIITGEPPPPQAAGMANLYSREYFALGRDRLNPGGILTYWLPVEQMPSASVRAVVAGFCEVFPECSLWTGAGSNGMLVGVKEGGRVPTAREFRRQWEDPAVGPEMRALGLEEPGQLGALYLDDGPGLTERLSGRPPLTDDFPYRLWPKLQPQVLEPVYEQLMEPAAARARFVSSPHIRRIWPAESILESLPFFDYRLLADTFMNVTQRRPLGFYLEEFHRLVTTTRLRTLPLWILSLDMDRERLVRAADAKGVESALVRVSMGDFALASRSWAEAADRYVEALQRYPRLQFDAHTRAIYALLMAGRRPEAREMYLRAAPLIAAAADGPAFRAFLRGTFDFPDAGR